MTKYGQFCPVAKSLEILGDRWTLLIVRDMLGGVHHFNELERGLPGISRALLAARLRHLQQSGIIEKQHNGRGRNSTEYLLTPKGYALVDVIKALWQWGETWAFTEPTPDELDPILLMWWLRGQASTAPLPPARVVTQFDFYGAQQCTLWLLLEPRDVSLCITDPGYAVDVLVTADLATLYKLWGRRINYGEALRSGLRVESTPTLQRAFPTWFGWTQSASPAPVQTTDLAALV